MRPRLRLALLAAVALFALTSAPAAHAASPALLRQIVAQLRAGTFEPCKYSPAQLQNALASIPPDFDEYAPQVRTAIEDALNRQGSCGAKKTPGGDGSGTTTPSGGGAAPGGGGGSPGGTASPPVGGAAPPSGTSAAPAGGGGSPPPAPTAQAAPRRVTPAPRPIATTSGTPVAPRTQDGGGTPAVLAVLAVLAGLAALAALLAGVLRAGGWEPRWAPGMRHAWAEAGYRSGGTWGDFRDWLRLGR